jgi:hypothetical protein
MIGTWKVISINNFEGFDKIIDPLKEDARLQKAVKRRRRGTPNKDAVNWDPFRGFLGKFASFPKLVRDQCPKPSFT